MDKASKKEQKEQRRLQELEMKEKEQSQNKMKWIIISLASVLFLGFFITIIVISKQNKVSTSAVTLSAQGHMRGDENAPNTLVEFSDLQCPACRAYEPFVVQLLKDYDGKVKLLYKHFPLSGHPFAKNAIYAAEAAGKQGKFWEMHDILFEKQEEWGSLTSPVPDPTPFYEKYAEELKLDVEQFKKDMADKSMDEAISKSQDEGIASGVSATPTFYINGIQIESARSYEDFKKKISKHFK